MILQRLADSLRLKGALKDKMQMERRNDSHTTIWLQSAIDVIAAAGSGQKIYLVSR